MASKLFAPFKKFPQQLPIFKKSIDKFKDVPMGSFNSVYGIPDDITCTSYDNKLNLFALGTKKGEIKIYGSSGLLCTLVGNPPFAENSPVQILKFIEGQARLISVLGAHDIIIWEYRLESSLWTSSSFFSQAISDGKMTTFDVTPSLAWKSNSDDLIELMIFGSSENKIAQVLIIGNTTDMNGSDEFYIDVEALLSKCPDLPKDYEVGNIDQICFNPICSGQVYFSFKNGLVLVLEIKVSKEPIKEVTVEAEVTKNEVSQEKVIEETDKVQNEKPIEETNENASPETQNVPETEAEKEKTNEQNLDNEKTEDKAEKSESEKEKHVGETVPKSDEVKPDKKNLKDSTELPPNAFIHTPKILNYILNKKINSICWLDNKIVIASDDSDLINVFEVTGEGTKLSEPDQIITVADNVHTVLSKLAFFRLKCENMGIFITSENDKQNLLILTKNDKLYSEIETPSQIIDYMIFKCPASDDDDTEVEPRVLLIICESQLIAIDLQSEDLSEIQCPYLGFQNTSRITSLTGIIQAPALLFANTQTVNEVFKDWPLKSPVLPNEKIDEDTSIDIFGTGHADGSICIWQVMQSGVLNLLIKVESTFLFNSPSDKSNSPTRLTSTRKQVGHSLIESEDVWLPITNIQLILHSTSNFADSSSNELFCIVGSASGSVLVFKYDGSDTRENLTEIFCVIQREDVNWMYVENIPDFVTQPDLSDIGPKLPNLRSIIKIFPSTAVTSLAFQPAWELLGIGSTFGLVLVDLRENKCVFSHMTIPRKLKPNAAAQPPLSMGQQLKKSIRQSFRKLKKLKPATKHTYTVNEDKSKDKEEAKPIEKEEAKPTEKEEEKEPTKSESEEKEPEKEEAKEEAKEAVEDAEITEEKPKEEVKDQTEEHDNAVTTGETAIADAGESEIMTINISTKDRPSTTVGSLLIVNTSLTSSNKIPCLFAGTNIGAIYAFEISFGKDDDDNITVNLSKELHLQHKAPILSMEIINSNHAPLISSVDQIGSYQRKFKNTDEIKIEDEKPESEPKCESKECEVVEEVGPSGDSENKDDAKQKSGTLPASGAPEEVVEQVEGGARRSVDSSKEKIPITNPNMKKSGTLPASFLQAIGKSQGTVDSHELLVVSEEQVKLFNLPSLKAKHKYKVVDTGHHFSHSKAVSSQEPEIQDKKQTENANAEVQNETLTSKQIVRRISSVGLCKMRSQKSTGNKWSVSIALTNGEIIGLQSSNLKKYLSNVYNYSTRPILAGISNGELNLITSYASKHNIQVTDFTQSYANRYEPALVMVIPKDVRPVIEEKTEEAKPNETAEDAKQDATETGPIVNGHHPDIVNGHDEDEEKDQMGDEAVVQNTSAVHHGDITMDSIKEYITNVDGNVTIKTFESSKEKQITVDGGQIVTTIHEKQIKDGEIIKDDVVKITSDTRAPNECSLSE